MKKFPELKGRLAPGLDDDALDLAGESGGGGGAGDWTTRFTRSEAIASCCTRRWPRNFPASAETPARPAAGPWKGSDLVGLTYRHPFLDDGRTRQIYPADFVTADAGTGLVHIAPGHGHDDYLLGQQHGLPVLAPVDDRGCLTAEAGVPELTGVYVFKANPLIVKMLGERGLLFAQEEYRHDYPHCWRSKTPIVFRAVKQWFIKVDAFRAAALTAIDGVEFVPPSGRNRIRGAVESRPDWCISRQRTWGVPLPVFYGEGGQPLQREDVARAFANLVEKEGSGIWFSRTGDELIGDINRELEKAGEKFRLPLGLKKGRDTLDVWIDSGTSWAAVLGKHPALSFPADLYLEGSDQHRGWFQSSLLTAVAARGEAPYRAVLTNGFVVDIEGKKLSKSGTGYQKPVDLMTLVNEHGADVLRLWVASQDYQDDIPSPTTSSRGWPIPTARSATRSASCSGTWPISNRPATPCRARNGPGSYRYVHDTYAQLNQYAQACYARYDFPQVYQAVNRFCSVELSALYVDVLKDRLYCHAADDPARRAAQTVMHEVAPGPGPAPCAHPRLHGGGGVAVARRHRLGPRGAFCARRGEGRQSLLRPVEKSAAIARRGE